MLGHSKNMHKGDSRLMSNDALHFTEAQLQHQHLANGIEKYFENFRTPFSNSDNKFLRFA